MNRALTSMTIGIASMAVLGSGMLVGVGHAATDPNATAAPALETTEHLDVSSDSPIDPGTGNPTSVVGQSVTFTVTLTVPNTEERRRAAGHVSAAARPAGFSPCTAPVVRTAAISSAPCAKLFVENYNGTDDYDEPLALTQHTTDPAGDDIYSGSQSFSELPVGEHEVDAYYPYYSRDTRYRLTPNGESRLYASLEQDVIAASTGPNRRPSKTVLTSSANPSDSGDPVTFTATVTPADGGSGTPTGTVIFAADGANHPETLTGGIATFEDDALADGAHEVTATYTGDSIFTSSADHLFQVVGNGGGTGGLNGLLFTEPGAAALGLITVGGTSQDLPLRAASQPASLAIGPDARVWVVEAGKDAIAAVDTTGHETDYALPADAFPTSIVAGADGRLWFTEPGLHRMAAITTDGTITNYPLGKHAEPFELAAGPNGRLWFTEPDLNRIGRIKSNGHHKSFPVRDNSKPLGITEGPDGAMWFTEVRKHRIGRITTAGDATDIKVARHSKPSAIVTGPDGALWFTEAGLGRIGRVSVGGSVTSFAARSGGKPSAIVVGPDQRLWFTEPGANRIGAMTATGTFTDYPVAAHSSPSAIISLS